MLSITRILCPVDFSEFSRHALEHAVAIARHHHAAVTALNVFALAPVAETVPAGSPITIEPARIPPEKRAELRHELRAFASAVDAAHVTVDLDVMDGDPANAILKEAARRQADLIVLGTHGRKGFARWVLGSVTERVLREAPCPVLAVPRGVRDRTALGFGRILCAIDFSGASGPALEYASALSEDQSAELLALNVVEPSTRGGAGLQEPTSTSAFDAAAEFKRIAADRLIALIPASLRKKVTVRELVTLGSPATEILRVAERDRCDLIVLGVSKRTGADLLLFGSTTQEVLRLAKCPILTVASLTVV